MSAPLLEVEGLHVAFGDAEPVVRDVSFTLTPGRVLALVGESGSGKSVSAMSVLGLLPPEAHVTGSIRFRGAELVGASDDDLRAVRGAGIGVVFQEPMNSFTPVLSIGTQIAEAITAHPTDLDRRAVSARTDELLRAAGLSDPARIRKAYPHELSGGQLQRAMIAMALAGDPVASSRTSRPPRSTSRCRPASSTCSARSVVSGTSPSCSSRTTWAWWRTSPTRCS